MSEWQPIETAPRDGTRILLTDGTLFTAGSWSFYEEPALTSLGYGDPADNIPRGGFPSSPGHRWSVAQVPNPKAGERQYFWRFDNPVAFIEVNGVTPDYDGEYEKIEPTHWMPCLSAPDPSTEAREDGSAQER